MFDPLDFFYLARELHYHPIEPESASMRSSISRAYYAAFLAAREKAGLSNQETDIHKKVEKHFRQKNKAKIANTLKDLKQRRHKADYDLAKQITSRETGNAIRLANKLLISFGITPEARK